MCEKDDELWSALDVVGRGRVYSPQCGSFMGI